jgi:hypothetical protein
MGFEQERQYGRLAESVLPYCSAVSEEWSAASQRHLRPDRHDARRIDAPMALVIMVLDVEEIDRLGDARQVVKLS